MSHKGKTFSAFEKYLLANTLATAIGGRNQSTIGQENKADSTNSHTIWPMQRCAS